MVELRQMDTVVLLTTRNISYLSGAPSERISPDGYWRIAAIVGGQLLLTKGTTVIRIPPQDVKLIQSYSLTLLDKQLKEVRSGLPIADIGS